MSVMIKLGDAAREQGVRVAIVTPSFGAFGGLEAFVIALHTGLRTDVSGVVSRLTFKRSRGFELKPELRAGVAPLGSSVSIVDRASRGLVDVVRWADVVHAQNPSPDVVVLAKLFRRPLLINVINHHRPRRSAHVALWRWSLRRADRRFYISEFVRRTWEGEKVWPRSEVVFPICELADGVLAPEQRKGFVFAARWIENKGLDTLVEAYANAGLNSSDWPLTLIGDGPLRPRIEQRVRELGLRHVCMPGFVPSSVKATFIRSARWMVVPPNTQEDFGLTAIEARYLGVPCVITRDGGVPEAAGDQAITCRPGDIADLTRGLRAAAAMSGDQYARWSHATRAALLPRLARADYYAQAYRELCAVAGTARTQLP